MSLSDFSTNSESEGQRLSQLYSAMPEGELQKVADDFYSLSDLAREKLREEIVRRGVDIVIPVQPKPTDEMSLSPSSAKSPEITLNSAVPRTN